MPSRQTNTSTLPLGGPRNGRPLPVAALVVVVFVVGNVISTGLFVSARDHTRDQRRINFERQANHVAATLHSSFELPLEVVRGVPALFDASGQVTRAQFSTFAKSVLRTHPSIYALEWIPRVTSDQRATVEVTASQGLPNFTFKEVGPNDGLIPAKPREEYLPILYMEPPNAIALGFDVGSSAERRAPADLARNLGEAVASPRIRLVEDAPDVFSVAIFVPVFEAGGVPATEVERRSRLRGFGAEVFRVEPVVARALRQVDMAGLDFVLIDASAPKDLALLYESVPGLHQRAPTDSFHRSRTIPYAHRTWSVQFYSKPGAATAGTPWDVLIRGIVISALASVFVYAVGMILGLRRQVQVAQQLGQYTLDDRLGQGGMGVVYRARHSMLRRPTAIKLMSGKDPKNLLRFEREVQMTSRLTHPNTIAIYDYGRTPDGVFYYAMELLDGITLEELVEFDGPQPPSRVLHILRQVCGAIAEAHSIDLIHRDIKPANVMLTRRGRIPDFAKVLDFGLVKDLQDQDAASLSMEGSLLGTPLYLAPEAITKPSKVGAAADLYAIGAVGYYLLAATPVFVGKSLVEICGQHLHSAPVPPSMRSHRPIPVEVEQLILRCLAKDPGQRPASADALLLEIEACERKLGHWTTEQAERWWEEHAEDVLRRARRARKALKKGRATGVRTMAVDISHRGKAETKPS
jgi:eukaryotic-like serine/threonine-protein kinase